MIFTEKYYINMTFKALNDIFKTDDIRKLIFECKHLGISNPLLYKNPQFDNVKFKYIEFSMGNCIVNFKLKGAQPKTSRSNKEKLDRSKPITAWIICNTPTLDQEFIRINFSNNPAAKLLDFEYLLNTVTGIEVKSDEVYVFTDKKDNYIDDEDDNDKKCNGVTINIGNVINDKYIMLKEYFTVKFYVKPGHKFTPELEKILKVINIANKHANKKVSKTFLSKLN